MPDIWITTTDNPFDFFTQFDDWFQFDESKGYHTCSYVARIALDAMQGVCFRGNSAVRHARLGLVYR